ncbi:MAG: response regulator transcription factor [Calditrichaeota bacterium]|nr:response regulator transcription factor [Calditrichota bacterium]MCB0296947.1 response regulator transcription factor [Calditrichota bacterium]MCB0304146.1 response regulator transcription factor [Calditrichota bacterium]MCB9087284.1 response regulator transcription factor [Calditrichia bacterium]
MYKILIVEDEPQMRMGLRDNLEFEGYTVDTAEDGRVGLEKILENPYDLILLDVMMPHLSGFDVCKKAREKGIRTPVIMLTAKGEEIDKVLGLELGADDYITKPFSLRELLARIKAVLRRAGEAGNAPEASGEVTIGNLTVDFSTYDAYMDERAEPMSHKEFELLKYLWQHQGQTVSRDELLNEVWGYEEFPTTRTVDNFILKLRKRIESDPARPRFILTVHGIGYKLVP